MLSLSEPFDTASWMLVGIVAIHAATIMILFFEWLSPSGFNMKVNPSGAAQRLVLLISLRITYGWFFVSRAPTPDWTNYYTTHLDNIVNLNDTSPCDAAVKRRLITGELGIVLHDIIYMHITLPVLLHHLCRKEKRIFPFFFVDVRNLLHDEERPILWQNLWFRLAFTE